MARLAPALTVLAVLAAAAALAAVSLRPFPPPGGAQPPAPQELPPPVPAGGPGVRPQDWLASWETGAPRLPAAAAAAFGLRPPPPAPGPGALPPLQPPAELRAAVEDGGIRLRWLPDPANPAEEVRYRLTRWAGEGAAEELGDTGELQYFDPVRCEGLTYHYRVRARMDAPAGAPTATESAPAAVSLEFPASGQWSAEGLGADGGIVLVYERHGRRSGPHPAHLGQAVGDTGWFLESLAVMDTEVRIPTTIPRFDALGRRVIIGALPASRSREVNQQRLLATIRLTDPCGTSWNLELLLPEGTARPGQ
ncbi:MAG: hypothetical protein EYC70_14585 [Planctomycetota bacterium]|nr:MAG: hypothetical protein EYC70_14585 [Planctomycetota bacterium]